MAKLQQMNEMSKQSSEILLTDGYLTHNGKRYDECLPFEKEAFNEALHVVRGDKKRKVFMQLQTMGNENYIPNGKVSEAMFNCLVGKVHSIEDSNIDEFGIEAKHGVYELFVRGAWLRDSQTNHYTIQITYNDSGVMYRGEYYDLLFTDEQISTIMDLLYKEYERLDREAEEERRSQVEDELYNYEMQDSYNFSKYGFLTV